MLSLCFLIIVHIFLAEWSRELRWHFLPHTRVGAPRQSKGDVPGIKDKWGLFSCHPSVAQSHVLHILFTFEPWLPWIALWFFLVYYFDCLWQHFTKCPATGDTRDCPDLSLVASVCLAPSILFFLWGEGDRMGGCCFFFFFFKSFSF